MLFPQILWLSCDNMGGFGDCSFGRREIRCAKPKEGFPIFLFCYSFLMEREKCQSMDGRLRSLGLGQTDEGKVKPELNSQFVSEKADSLLG